MDNNYVRPTGFNFLPVVVKNILIINVIMFLATQVLLSRGIDLNDMLGLHYFLSEKFHIWQFFTYMFMHGNIMHIFFNMFAVFMFGAAMENIWGPKKFLTYYLLTGLGAAVAHYAIVYFQMDAAMGTLNNYIASPSIDKLQSLLSSNVFSGFSSRDFSERLQDFIRTFNETYTTNPSQALNMSVEFMKESRMEVYNAPVVIGASGALFGLLLAYGMTFPNNFLYVYLILPIKAKYFVIIYGLIELFSGVANYSGDNVAHFAHLGGLVTGFIIIKIWDAKNKNKRNNIY